MGTLIESGSSVHTCGKFDLWQGTSDFHADIPKTLHSGQWRDGSRGLRVFGGGSVLTAPTDSSVPLVINFYC